MVSSDKGFQGTIVNWTLVSLHGGSVEITFTVPSLIFFSCSNTRDSKMYGNPIPPPYIDYTSEN